MEACRRVVLYSIFLCTLAGHVGCTLVYFHTYYTYDRAYDLCRRNNMRMLRVDNDTKLQTVTKFAEGLKNFSMSTGGFALSLRYDVNTSRYLWPDGTVNTVTTIWESDEPQSPETLQCVTQKKGKWRTNDCMSRDTFLCETGYALDPAIETYAFPHYPVFKTFRRLTNAPANPQDQVMTAFKEEENSLDMYRGFRVFLIVDCAIWCTMDPVCAGITLTTSKDPQNNVCILLK